MSEEKDDKRFQSPLGEVVKETTAQEAIEALKEKQCFNPLSGKW